MFVFKKTDSVTHSYSQLFKWKTKFENFHMCSCQVMKEIKLIVKVFNQWVGTTVIW